MRKSLIALALLSALAVSAQAAEVNIYGKVDVGLQFRSVDNGFTSGRQDSLKMETGQTAGSRVGMYGWEDLGNGYKVGFRLETGFTPDTGALGQGNRLFGRQADLRITGPFGTVKFGRMGALASGYPDTGLFGGNVHPFAIGFSEVMGFRHIFTGNWAPLDNAITYSTPSFAGWQVIGQYSFDRDTTDKSTLKDGTHGTENESTVDRFMALGIRYQSETTEFNFVIDSTNYATYGVNDTIRNWGDDDSLVVTTAVRHNTDFAKLYAGAQFYRDAREFTQDAYQAVGNPDAKFLGGQGPRDGWALTVGADIPVPVGIAKVALGYMDVENSHDSDESLKRYSVGVGYWYDLSKRTALHAEMGYVRDKLEGKRFQAFDDADVWTANLGLVHNF